MTTVFMRKVEVPGEWGRIGHIYEYTEGLGGWRTLDGRGKWVAKRK